MRNGFLICSAVFLFSAVCDGWSAVPVVVLPDSPTAIEQSAASELAGELEKVLGRRPDIVAEKNAADVVSACREKGLLVLTAKDRVRLLPALNVPMDLLVRAVEILAECT